MAFIYSISRRLFSSTRTRLDLPPELSRRAGCRRNKTAWPWHPKRWRHRVETSHQYEPWTMERHCPGDSSAVTLNGRHDRGRDSRHGSEGFDLPYDQCLCRCRMRQHVSKSHRAALWFNDSASGGAIFASRGNRFRWCQSLEVEVATHDRSRWY